jgi:membrane-associated protein
VGGVEAVSVVSSLVDSILNLHGGAAYALVGGLAFSEAALFVGFVLPGETAVLLGGVLAHRGSVSLLGIAAVAVAAAITGDSVGYEVGRRYGTRLLGTRVFAKRQQGLERGQQVLRDKGGRAVFLARFTAFLRAVMPGLAGSARMPYPRFLAFNAAGGLIWAVGFTLLGYLAGASYQKVEKVAGRASAVLLAVIVLAVVIFVLRRRRRREHDDTQPDDPTTPPT